MALTAGWFTNADQGGTPLCLGAMGKNPRRVKLTRAWYKLLSFFNDANFASHRDGDGVFALCFRGLNAGVGSSF